MSVIPWMLGVCNPLMFSPLRGVGLESMAAEGTPGSGMAGAGGGDWRVGAPRVDGGFTGALA